MEDRTIKILFLITIVGWGILTLFNTGCYYDNEQVLYQNSTVTCDSTNVTYTKSIAPILQANCNTCHNQSIASGGIITVGYNDLIIIVNNGRLWGAINHLGGYSFMPKNANKLSDCDIAIIGKWIHNGAPNN